jgi:hypothetical protein
MMQQFRIFHSELLPLIDIVSSKFGLNADCRIENLIARPQSLQSYETPLSGKGGKKWKSEAVDAIPYTH